jgi:hypothetical protein
MAHLAVQSAEAAREDRREEHTQAGRDVADPAAARRTEVAEHQDGGILSLVNKGADITIYSVSDTFERLGKKHGPFMAPSPKHRAEDGIPKPVYADDAAQVTQPKHLAGNDSALDALKAKAADVSRALEDDATKAFSSKAMTSEAVEKLEDISKTTKIAGVVGQVLDAGVKIEDGVQEDGGHFGVHTAGAVGGAAASIGVGFAAGAAIGSILPGPGTAVGALVGAGVVAVGSGIASEYAGEAGKWAGEHLFDLGHRLFG